MQEESFFLSRACIAAALARAIHYPTDPTWHGHDFCGRTSLRPFIHPFTAHWLPLCSALSQIAIMPAEQRAALRKGTAPYAKPHACPRCAAAFTRAGNLKRYVRTVHEKRRCHGIVLLALRHCAARGRRGQLP